MFFGTKSHTNRAKKAKEYRHRASCQLLIVDGAMFNLLANSLREMFSRFKSFVRLSKKFIVYLTKYILTIKIIVAMAHFVNLLKQINYKKCKFYV